WWACACILVVLCVTCSVCFFFSSRRRHTRWPRDWSSDVCSSDLTGAALERTAATIAAARASVHQDVERPECLRGLVGGKMQGDLERAGGSRRGGRRDVSDQRFAVDGRRRGQCGW